MKEKQFPACTIEEPCHTCMQLPERISDEDLVRLVCEKDQELFTEIVRRYETKLLRYAGSIVKDSMKTQDVVQNAFIKTFTNLRGFNPKLKFSSWIYRITHNEAMNELDKYRREVRLDDVPEIEAIPSSQKNAGEAYDDEQKRIRIRESLDSLPILYREPLFLYHIESRSYQEISDILRIPMGTVATRINRGKALLKQAYMKKFPHAKQYGQAT